MSERHLRHQRTCDSPLLSFGVYVFCFAVSLYYLFSEKVPVNNGFGWDGKYYANLVANFPQEFAHGNIDGYYIRRIIPSILVSLPARILDVSITRNYIVYGFVVANVLNIFLSSLFWLRICKLLNLGTNRTLVSYILLMTCFPVVKMLAYDPVLTDSFAFLGAIAMLYFWLALRRVALALAVLVNLFIWPSTAVIGTFLLLFPRGTRISLRKEVWTKLSRGIRLGALLVIALPLCYLLLHRYSMKSAWMEMYPLRGQLLPLSILLALAYVYKCAEYLTDFANEEGRDNHLRIISSPAAATWLLIVVGGMTLASFLAPKVPTITTLYHANFILTSCIELPLLFLVSNLTFYGGAAAFAVLGARGMLTAARQIGVGFYGVLAFTLAMSISTEPRFILNGYPFLVLAIALSAPLDRLPVSQWSSLAVIQIIGSKVWLTIDATAADYGYSSGDRAKLLEYPAQWFFMNFGAWMSNLGYLINLLWSGIILFVVYLLVRKIGVDTGSEKLVG